MRNVWRELVVAADVHEDRRRRRVAGGDQHDVVVLVPHVRPSAPVSDAAWAVDKDGNADLVNPSIRICVRAPGDEVCY